MQDPAARAEVDANNRALLTHWLSQGGWDGILLGNLDLLGTELFSPLLASGLPLAASHRLRHAALSTRTDAPKKQPLQAACRQY